MQNNKDSPLKSYKDAGVSEVIGSILLISVVIAAVSIVGVVLFSQATPQKIPDVNFMTGYDNNNNLYLFHNGGDTLTKGNFYVIVDGVLRDDYTISDASNEWSLGTNLIIPLGGASTATHSVAIVSNTTGGGSIVLRSASSSLVVSATQQPDVIPASMYPPIISVPSLTQNVTNRTVIFFREMNTTISTSSFLRFNVSRQNSTIYTTVNCPTISGSNVIRLMIGDTVTITQLDTYPQTFRISGIGDQLLELNAGRVHLNVTNASGIKICNPTGINHTWITGYNGLQSGLNISTTASPVLSNRYTALTVLNYTSNMTPQYTSQIIMGLDLNRIVINNASPSRFGLFTLVFDRSTNSTFFIGDAARVTRGVSQVYP